eukprot:2746751-Rhodomonas_salina.1
MALPHAILPYAMGVPHTPYYHTVWEYCTRNTSIGYAVRQLRPPSGPSERQRPQIQGECAAACWLTSRWAGRRGEERAGRGGEERRQEGEERAPSG